MGIASPKTQCVGEKDNGVRGNSWCFSPLCPAAFLTVRRERTPGTALELGGKWVLIKGRGWVGAGGASGGNPEYGLRGMQPT